MFSTWINVQLCLIFTCVCALQPPKDVKYFNNTITKSKKWDFLTFTQTWPTTSCIIWESQSPQHKCNITSQVTSWTVHGIWPSSVESDDPSFCNGSAKFNVSQIQTIVPELVKYWPNVYAQTAEDSLWSHEWEKHGTCAASLHSLDTELRFFNQGLKWIKQFNMLGILQNSGILPSYDKPVLAYDIENAIQNYLHVKPLLVCDTVKKTKTTYIYEIEICFNKDLELINCPTNALENRFINIGAARCSDKALVWYPPIPHQFKKQHPNVKTKCFRSGSLITANQDTKCAP